MLEFWFWVLVFEIPIKQNDIGQELFVMLRLMSYGRAVLVAKAEA
jgi:hypothetical protein